MSTIDPSKATPQAPRVLRAGSKGAARAAAAATKGYPAPAAMDDDDEDDDGPESEREEAADKLAAHETNRAAAETAHRAAADAYAACKGTDSAAALMAAEDAGDAAHESHQAAKASSMALRGAAPPEAPGQDEKPAAPSPAAPGGQTRAAVPVASLARAIAAAGGTADAQVKIAASVGFADRMLALFGAATLEEAEGLARAAQADAKDAVELRAAAAKAKAEEAKRAKVDAEAALDRKLRGAVRAGKFARAELFDVQEVAGVDAGGAPVLVEQLTPKAWTRELAPKALDAMIAAKQARAGTGGLKPDETPTNISAAVRAYGEARGYTEAQIAALAAQLPATAGAKAPSQETAR